VSDAASLRWSANRRKQRGVVDVLGGLSLFEAVARGLTVFARCARCGHTAYVRPGTARCTSCHAELAEELAS
jgi:uncharacterized OB-fold protein